MKLIIYEQEEFKYLNDFKKQGGEDEKIVMVPSDHEGIEQLISISTEIFAPICFILDQWNTVKNYKVLVYSPLSIVSGANKMLTILKEKHLNNNGVFRLRRRQHVLNLDMTSSSDIYFLSIFFGKWKTIYPKFVQSQEANIVHLLVAVTFENGIMAHLEYTCTEIGREILEMEWSGKDVVLEYTSEKDSLQTVTDNKLHIPLYWDNSLVISESITITEDMYVNLSRLRDTISLK